MNDRLSALLASRPLRRLLIAVGALALLGALFSLLYPLVFETYVGKVNAPLTFSSSQTLNDDEFEALAAELSWSARHAAAAAIVGGDPESFERQVKIEMLMQTPSRMREHEPSHIKYFRDAGIRRYEGPKTCLECHATMRVRDQEGRAQVVDTLDDLVNSVHFKFQSDAGGGFSTFGYDGRRVNAPGTRPIPIGKINRACGIPGSFSWTGWAALIAARPEAAQGAIEMRSEGCGQCHIGGNYQPATEKMMPIGDVPEVAKEGIDCLICHAAEYDMNQRYVIEDSAGLRWNQDRSLRAALTVGQATTRNCLLCHQHNMGGDAYAHNEAAQALGEHNPRLLHKGAKRGNPFSPESDVHAAAGLLCTDCHVPQGHKIPRGLMGVDLVANDLPEVEVSCVKCHSEAPHNRSQHKALLNGHLDRLACTTCHVRSLEENNVVLRDWVHPTWDPEEGIFKATDIYRSGAVGQGFTFLWFNGNGTFLANALGNHPDGSSTYDPLMQQLARIEDPEVIAAVRARATELKETYPHIDIDDYVRAATDPLSQLTPEQLEQRRALLERNLRVHMDEGQSKLYPFKLFNAMMYEDLGNQGPFGAMILPFDYATYHETGDSQAAMIQAIRDPIVRRMYETPFKLYMMDEFMAYFGVAEGWRTQYPLASGELRDVEPRWMRQMGSLKISHGIQPVGRDCIECHSPNGILDYQGLGYSPERAAELQHLDIVENLRPAG
ncbi:MAG: nitrite reductase [Sphingobacteriia bacterium]|nr:nitrite reductase [Sphingobacteriia bacterium]NCC39734.1 nitrite reductase [Gammaproteobacteria bacterium]